jgi:hypothetical protein
MEYTGLETTDLRDVCSLNAAFLDYLSSSNGEQLRRELPASLRPVVVALSSRQIERLAAVPFLLMSLSESDDAYWDRLMPDRPVRDLFTSSHNETDPLTQIASATLAFLWQLARKNPYAVRLICGASLKWCEQLAAYTLLQVLQRAAEDQRLVLPRLAEDSIFWQRLLGAGLSSEFGVRRASHLSALQAVLTPVVTTTNQRFRSAACYSSVPTLEIREQRNEDDDE